MKRYMVIFLGALLLSACKKEETFDATGTFEAQSTIVAAEATGNIEQFNIEEGDVLSAGQQMGYIDSTQILLRKKQLIAQTGATLSQQPDISLQIAVLNEELRHTKQERDRVARLVKSDAATGKQLDDANATVALVERKITAQRSTLTTTTTSIQKSTNPVAVQIAAINDQLSKCRIINPINGTVLTKYALAHEFAATGQPLYKIANLDFLDLHAYITGDQLHSIRLGEQVLVLVDNSGGGYKTYGGKITWISDEAEFTPKSIQTQQERANQVYEIKIHVKNDGYLKIGQYAAVRFNSADGSKENHSQHTITPGNDTAGTE